MSCVRVRHDTLLYDTFFIGYVLSGDFTSSKMIGVIRGTVNSYLQVHLTCNSLRFFVWFVLF